MNGCNKLVKSDCIDIYNVIKKILFKINVFYSNIDINFQ